MIKRTLVLGVVILSILALFQNCSAARFAPSQGSSQAGAQQILSTPNFQLQPANLDFGKVALRSSISHDVTITNTSDQPLVFSISLANASYTVDASACQSVAANGTCVIHFTFTPTDVNPVNVSVNVTATTADQESVDSGQVTLTGSGTFVAPSSADQLALVGWYAYKQPTKLSFSATANNANCPAVTSANGHGQNAEYCYEPSGAHGMYFGDATKFSLLTSYMLQQGSTLNTNVTTLDQLFPLPADRVSDNACLQEGLFYYALSYLIVPSGQNLTASGFDVRFSVDNVDDGLELVSNGVVMGHDYFGNSANFSLNLQSGSSTPVLQNGANTLAAIWVDDCATQRYITGAKVLFNGATLTPLVPNVMRGYIYSKLDGSTTVPAQVAVLDASGTQQTVTTDSNGFFQLTGIANGAAQVSVTYGSSTAQETVNFDHHQANTAIVDFSRGY